MSMNHSSENIFAKRIFNLKLRLESHLDRETWKPCFDNPFSQQHSHQALDDVINQVSLNKLGDLTKERSITHIIKTKTVSKSSREKKTFHFDGENHS